MRGLLNPRAPRHPVLAIAVARGITELELSEILSRRFYPSPPCASKPFAPYSGVPSTLTIAEFSTCVTDFRAVREWLPRSRRQAPGIDRTPSVERYCPRSGQWVVVRRMNRKRSDAAACALKSRVYVCGGFNGRRCLDSAEEYTPETDSWSFVHSLPFARNSHRMIKMGAYVYVLGGFDGRRRLTSVVRSLAEPPFKWQSVAHMRRARSTFALAQLDDELYVIGGYDGKTFVASVERYSPQDNTWRAAPELTKPVSALAACVVTGAPIAKKLSVRGTL
ncbi:kelch-like protein 10 [Rhipicephalus sanguineus]|uniref:kelch-like protein 10 n=1 Tax=Rhipicephalus sanguineus TaxID=34632 RepID=UPI001893E432|nr:kelch-like protein 10 [Rhipicephalus sanguineus]